MRCFLAGSWVLLALLVPVPAAFAQVRGEVESIGFQNLYRPDCWTPMTIKIVPETGKSDVYKIQVRQEDQDRDRVIFEREISVTGNPEGQIREQRFRMYFIPQPTGEGLPDARNPTANRIKDIDEALVVNLCTAGGKLITRLPITTTITNIDPKSNQLGWADSRRGTRFILTVSDGRSQLVFSERNTTVDVRGLVEDFIFVPVRIDDLPENVIGYEAIDGIIWLNADPAALRAGGEEKRRALEEYIRRGGRMVICQSPEWQKILEFGDLLPVDVSRIDDKQDAEPLRSLAQPRPGKIGAKFAFSADPAREKDPWEKVRGPFRLARATPRAGAVVDVWIRWDEKGKDRSPYIARKRAGLGSVTWVAQDLADPAVTRTKSGWIHVWQRVFDWADDPVVLADNQSDQDLPEYAPAVPMDLGQSVSGGIDLPSKTAWLITLAIVFFLAYWLVAGPGGFFYLVSRRRAHLSWFAFGATALAAIGLTIVLVKATLRGPPEMKHFTVIRVAPDGPAFVNSRFGLYIPRDGSQKIELRDAAPGTVSTLSAFAIHPEYLVGKSDIQGPEYTVPVIEATSSEPAAAEFPYRSTLKALQATWTGEIGGKVQGSAALLDSGWIEGSITNGTGQRLRNVYVAFKYPGESALAGDHLLYLPSWEPGVTLDLNKDFNTSSDGKRWELIAPNGPNPESQRKVRGKMDIDWPLYWYPPLRGGMMSGTKWDDTNHQVRRSLPMLSFFERLPPAQKKDRQERFELLRRGGRSLDISQALAAGSLVVLGEVEGPLPFPLYVEGNRVLGSGLNLYQFILPLDHSKLSQEENDETDTTTTIGE